MNKSKQSNHVNIKNKKTPLIGNKKIKKSFKKWKFGTINIRTGKDDGKIYSVVKEIDRANLEFCAIQEIRRIAKEGKIVELDNGNKYEIHWSGYQKKREAGVGLVIRIHPDIIVGNIEYINHRIISSTMRIYGLNIKVVSIYAPTENYNGKKLLKQIIFIGNL